MKETLEYRYARPIAEALRQDAIFRSWFLAQTKFVNFAEEARLLDSEQKARRSRNAENWWRSYWAGSAYPYRIECGERETDLLAVFEALNGRRFAVHVEVKAPGDRFGVEQARDYASRAICWSGPGRAPQTVLPHDEATTVLCCERSFARSNPDEAGLFAAVITFDDISARIIGPFPDDAHDTTTGTV